MNLTMNDMAQEWDEVFKKLLDPEADETAVFDTLEMIEADMDIKADHYARFIGDLAGDAATIDAEIKRLQERKKFILNRRDRLKATLYASMKSTGRTSFKTALYSFAIQGNGGSRPVKLLDEVPERWRKPGEPDMGKIREALENGQSLPFAVLGDRGESLRIR